MEARDEGRDKRRVEDKNDSRGEGRRKGSGVDGMKGKEREERQGGGKR